MEPAPGDGMPNDVLVVEDDPIIALDFEDTILSFGVKTVRTAANVAKPEKYTSHWPGNAGYGPGGALARPRSATIVITKDDGGRIGG
mgnify:CR=1 FL=1